MLTHFKIGARITTLIAINLIGLVVVGAIGVVSTSKTQGMLSRTEIDALKPIEQVSKLNESMQESFRQLLLAVQHNPVLPAAKRHNHPVTLHTEAMEKAIGVMNDALRDYRRSNAGAYFGEVATQVETSEAKLVEEGLRPIAAKILSGEYDQAGIEITATVLPLFNEVKKGAEQLLARHRDMAKDIERSADEQYALIRLVLLVGGAVIAVALVGGALLIAKSITRPLRSLTAAMTVLATGGHSVFVPGTDRNDEVGEMANAVQVFKDNIVETERLRNEKADLEGTERERRRADMRELAQRFEGEIGEIVDAVSSASCDLEIAANGLSKTAESAMALSSTVAQASDESSRNVGSVAASSEELAHSVGEIGLRVQESAAMTAAAVAQTQKTNEQINALSNAATRIGDVVELINTIAGQTNLLALNATIEAARAGDAGRGFAVVATEVKALAEQTAKATGEISQQISSIQSTTRDSVHAIQDISETIARMSEIATAVATAVEGQQAVTQEVSRNIHRAAQGTQQVASSIGDVQRRASETGSASMQVLGSAGALTQQSARLKSQVGKFLDSVQAA